MTITKGERTELRSIVRQQFKVLRAEVGQRRAEMHAEMEEEVVHRFREDDATWEACQFDIQQAVLACNRAVNDALYKHGYAAREGSERMWVEAPAMRKPDQAEQRHVRMAAAAKVEERVKGALLSLDRQEADLLRTLAVGAIESDEARSFLEAIPSVGELVPAARLAELLPGVEP